MTEYNLTVELSNWELKAIKKHLKATKEPTCSAGVESYLEFIAYAAINEAAWNLKNR